MFQISLLWIITGLAVIYHIGINELLMSLSIESSTKGPNDELDNPFYFSITLFIIVVIWPIIWLEYVANNRE